MIKQQMQPSRIYVHAYLNISIHVHAYMYECIFVFELLRTVFSSPTANAIGGLRFCCYILPNLFMNDRTTPELFTRNNVNTIPYAWTTQVFCDLLFPSVQS